MKLDKDTVLLVKSAEIGAGEPDLGAKLMQAFLKTLLESPAVPGQMIFMNSGIFLTTEGSSVVDLLKKFEEGGVEISSCGTCLAYYGRKEKLLIGRAGNMKETVEALMGLKKIIEM